VHKEIASLSSEAAKTAVVESGGDLSTDVVPAPFLDVSAQLSYPDPNQLWATTASDSTHPALRDALQNHAVLAALQQSLAVRAAELREGLRQWGFSQVATKRTKAHSDELENTIKETEGRRNKVMADLSRMNNDREVEIANLTALQRKHASLQTTSGALDSQLDDASKRAASLEEKRTSAQGHLQVKEQARLQFEMPHEEVERKLENLKAERSELEEESKRRLAAGKRLVERSREQAQKAAMGLEQAQQEFSSFQHAHTVLKEAHGLLGQSLQTEKAAHTQLEDQHEALNAELTALAHHYMSLLPVAPNGEPMPSH
jgi:chromosome segregation ATPase